MASKITVTIQLSNSDLAVDEIHEVIIREIPLFSLANNLYENFCIINDAMGTAFKGKL